MTPELPRLVVFDCDGTLVDSQATILSAMHAAWTDAGLAPPAAVRVRQIIGLSLEEAMLRLGDGLPHAEILGLVEGYKRSFKRLLARPKHEDPLFPGVVEALDALAQAGIALAVATGKGRPGLEATLDQHRLLDRFVSLQTADRARGKPHPEMLQNAMRDAGVAPERTLMVGDTVHDIEMARNAGVAGIGVAWGYHPAIDLADAGARMVISEMAALAPAAERLMPR